MAVNGDNPEHIHSFKNLSTDHGYGRTQWAIITDSAALESMKQLRVYTYGGLWIWPGWDYEGHKKGSNLIWYKLQSHFDNVTGALYIFHTKILTTKKKYRRYVQNKYPVSLWVTAHPDPTSDGAIYSFVSSDENVPYVLDADTK